MGRFFVNIKNGDVIIYKSVSLIYPVTVNKKRRNRRSK